MTKKIDGRLASPEGKGFKIEWNHAYSSSLASFNEVFETVEEGIAGAGLILKNFEPSNLPLEAYAVYMPFVKPTRAQLVNIDGNMRKKIPEMAKAYTKHNQVYLQSGGNDSMQLFTKFPVTKFVDLIGPETGCERHLCAVAARYGCSLGEFVDEPVVHEYQERRV